MGCSQCSSGCFCLDGFFCCFLPRTSQSCNPSVKKLFHGTRVWVFHQQWCLIKVKGHPALRSHVPAASDTLTFSCRVKYLSAIILHRCLYVCPSKQKKKNSSSKHVVLHPMWIICLTKGRIQNLTVSDCRLFCGDNQRWVLFTSWNVSVWCRRSAAFIQTWTVLCHVLEMNTLAGAALVFHRDDLGFCRCCWGATGLRMVRWYLFIYGRTLSAFCSLHMCWK